MNITNACVEWIADYFKKTNGKKAIIGISGGKDSTVAAALCVKALGKENVIGVLMPNGEQLDIEDSRRVCKFLDIKSYEINIGEIYGHYYNFMSENDLGMTNQSICNLPPRIRTTMLYNIAQCIDGGRVCNTSNACELFVGWGTHGGDTFGDFSPLGNLMVSQICEMGMVDLNLPIDLVKKAPADGLTGKTDEDNLGVKYYEIELFMKGQFEDLSKNAFENIKNRHKKNKFKTEIINVPKFNPNSLND